MTTTTSKRPAMAHVLLTDVPHRLRQAIAQAANDADTSMNAVAVEAIADAFGFKYEQSARRSAKKRRADTLYLIMPRQLRVRVNEERARTEVPASDIMKAILTARFL